VPQAQDAQERPQSNRPKSTQIWARSWGTLLRPSALCEDQRGQESRITRAQRLPSPPLSKAQGFDGSKASRLGPAFERPATRRLSENRGRREKVGKRGKTCLSTRRIARYLTRAYASSVRFYRFRSRFSILGQPPREPTRKLTREATSSVGSILTTQNMRVIETSIAKHQSAGSL
jgi:hypothetical protein